MRILTALILVLGLGLIPVASPALASPPSGHGPSGVTIPTHGVAELTFTSISTDPDTGFTIITGDVIIHGSFGVVWGQDFYEINPATGAFVGSGTRVAHDGSTYNALYQGQFISATDSVGSYTTHGGTGRFEGTVGSGSFASSRWANGLGSTSLISGTMTF